MDVGICGDVIAIIQDDKRVPNDWAVERDCHRCEQNAENGIQLLAGEEWPCFRRRFWLRPLAGLGACFRESFGAAHFVSRLYTADRALVVASSDVIKSCLCQAIAPLDVCYMVGGERRSRPRLRRPILC